MGRADTSRRQRQNFRAGVFFVASACGIETVPHMKLKAFFRGIVVLALVFVALYVGFRFPFC
jgi:hypothetical protein